MKLLENRDGGKMTQANDKQMESFKQQLIDPATLLSKQSKARDSAIGMHEELAIGRLDGNEFDDGRTFGTGQVNVDPSIKVD